MDMVGPNHLLTDFGIHHSLETRGFIETQLTFVSVFLEKNRLETHFSQGAGLYVDGVLETERGVVVRQKVTDWSIVPPEIAADKRTPRLKELKSQGNEKNFLAVLLQFTLDIVEIFSPYK